MKAEFEILKQIRKEFLTSDDPVIAFDCGEFEEKKQKISEHIERMNKLCTIALTLIEIEEARLSNHNE